ncbi:MAG: excinuclease ABC subunit UvrC [Bdellovibrionota bacterium]
MADENQEIIPSVVSESIKQKLKGLPTDSGVYLMKDLSGAIIYVGKAKNLKNRVSSYFQSTKGHSIKTRALVETISDFEVMLVDSEVSALLLERTLIKHHKPSFNILLRDDKEYPYVRIDLNSKWPRIKKVRQRKNDGATYLGPYGNAGYLQTMLQMLGRIFPTIKCSQYEFEHARRPCNYFHMKQCLAPCMNDKKGSLEVDCSVYAEMIKDCIAFLQGKNREVVKALTKKMQQASREEKFELAATYRDQLTAFTSLNQRQSAVTGNISDADVIGFRQANTLAAVHIILVREGYMIGQDNFILKTPIQSSSEALAEFLLQYYDNKFTPQEILLPFSIEDIEALEQGLNTPVIDINGTKNEDRAAFENAETDRKIDEERIKTKIRIPVRGEKKHLISIADRNAEYSLEEQLRKKQSVSAGLSILQEKLSLEKLPEVIECIDISNIQGSAIVASNVCFVNGKPAKDLYRLYNIQDAADSPDDFGSIREVMRRRMQRMQKLKDHPDLIVIDGGKGQLSAAMGAAAEFSEILVPLVSLAKSRFDKVINESKVEPTERMAHSKERFICQIANVL